MGLERHDVLEQAVAIDLVVLHRVLGRVVGLPHSVQGDDTGCASRDDVRIAQRAVAAREVVAVDDVVDVLDRIGSSDIGSTHRERTLGGTDVDGDAVHHDFIGVVPATQLVAGTLE